MCLICIEFNKLSIDECRKNLSEMSSELGDHVIDVEKMIQDREIKEIIDIFNVEFDQLWDDLFNNAGTLFQEFNPQKC